MQKKIFSKRWKIVMSLIGSFAVALFITLQFLPAQALVAGMSCNIVSGGTTQNPWVICKDASGNDVANEYYNHKNLDDTKPSPLPAIGNINWGYYDSTWNYRHNVEGYPNCDACMDSTTGHYRFIAMMRGTSGKIDGDKQRKVCILRNGQSSSEGPFYVIDVVKDTDKALNIGNGWIADVDQYTSKKWNNNGGGVLGQIVNCTSEQLGGSGGGNSATSQSSSSSSSQNNTGSTGGRQFPIMVQVGTAQQNIAADYIYAWFTDGSLGYASGNEPTQAAVDGKIGSVIAKVAGKTGNKMFMVSDKDTLKLVMDKHCEELYSAGIRYIGYDMEISPPGTEQQEMNDRQNTNDTNSVAIAAKLSVSCHGMKLWWGSIFANTVNINDDAMKVMMKAGLYGIAFQIQNQWDNPNGTPASQVAAAAKRYNADAAAVGVARPQYTEQVMTDGSNCISQKGTVPMATCQGAVQGLIKAGLMDNLSVWAQGGSITETFLKQVLGSYYGTPSSGGGSSSSSSSSNNSNNTSTSSSANTGNGDEITNKIDTLIKNSGFSGGVFVTGNHTILLNKAYGKSNRATNAANTTTTEFRIGSLTKTITAIAVMKLKEDGVLNLDAKICDTISCPTTNWSAVTYRQLLNNTSGIPDVEQYVGSIEKKQSTPSEVIALVANKSLEFIPGNSQKYSSTGYIMLGMAIEKISGLTFDQFIQTRIFDPIGLKNIDVEDNDCTTGTSNLSTVGYEGNSIASCIDMSVPFSAGNVISSAEDLGNLLEKLFSSKILSSASLDIVKTAAQITITGDKYAMGMWAGKYNSADMYYHQGRINGFGSRWTEIPVKGMTVVLLSNVNSEQNTLTGQILNILTGYIPPTSSSSSSTTSAVTQVTSVIPQVTPIINGKDLSSLFGPNKAHTKYDIINGNCTCNGADTACAATCAKGRYQLVISPINLPAYGTLKSIDKDMVDVWQIFCNITANSLMETEPYKSMKSKINIVCVNDLSCNNLTGCTGPAIDQTEIAGIYNASHQVVVDFGAGGYSAGKEDDVLGSNKSVSYFNASDLGTYRKVLVNHVLGHGIGGLMHPGNFAVYSKVAGYTQDMFCEFRGNCESYYGVFYDGKACSKSVMTFTKDSSGSFYTNYCDSELNVVKDQINKSLK